MRLVTSIHASWKQKDLVVESMGVWCIGKGQDLEQENKLPPRLKQILPTLSNVLSDATIEQLPK